MNRFIKEAYKHVGQGTCQQSVEVDDILVYPQRNNWACGPWALRHCFMKWGFDINPYVIAKLALSTRGGTGERKMELAAYRMGAKYRTLTLKSAVAAQAELKRALRHGDAVVLCINNDEHWIACLHHSKRGYLIFDSGRPGPVIQLRSWAWLKQCLRNNEGTYGIARVQRPR